MKSNLLYWACMLPEDGEDKFDCENVQKMLEDDWSYPECQNHLEGLRTPIHQAARHGNYEKLDLLLKNINQRYQFGDQIADFAEPKFKQNTDTDELTKKDFQKNLKKMKYGPLIK